MERRQLERLSSKYSWASRTDAWDVEQDRQKRDRAAVSQAEYDARIQRITHEVIERVEVSMQHWPEKLSPSLAMTMMDMATKLQRLTAGEATSITGTKHETIEDFLAKLGNEGKWE